MTTLLLSSMDSKVSGSRKMFLEHGSGGFRTGDKPNLGGECAFFFTQLYTLCRPCCKLRRRALGAPNPRSSQGDMRRKQV